MIARFRQLLVAVLFGVAGAAAGRAVAEMRRQQAAGEQPQLDLDRVNLRARDVVPGIVAAMRVTNRPWSWLHIPPWIAAFCVNFGVAAFASELGPLGRMARGEQGIPGFTDDQPWDAAPPEDGDQQQPGEGEFEATAEAARGNGASTATP